LSEKIFSLDAGKIRNVSVYPLLRNRTITQSVTIIHGAYSYMKQVIKEEKAVHKSYPPAIDNSKMRWLSSGLCALWWTGVIRRLRGCQGDDPDDGDSKLL
jgi:hypothetical protein